MKRRDLLLPLAIFCGAIVLWGSVVSVLNLPFLVSLLGGVIVGGVAGRIAGQKFIDAMYYGEGSR